MDAAFPTWISDFGWSYSKPAGVFQPLWKEGLFCEQLQDVFKEFRSLSVRNWMLLEPLWMFGHMGILVYPKYSDVAADLKEVVL